MNMTKTTMLMAALTALFMAIGYFAGGPQGMLIALAIAAVSNIMAWWNSDKMVLATYHAQAVTEDQAPDLYNMVRRMCNNANLPMPKVYIIQNDQPNAFATGRNPENAAVAVTTGLMDILSQEEIAGVLAHELAHIQNRDTLIMTVTATLAGAIGWLVNLLYILPMFQSRNDREGQGTNPLVMILIMMLAPLLASMVQFTISRTREYDADKRGAEICGNPLWLANALQKIEDAVRGHGIHNRDAEQNPATAHVFIINPLLGKGTDNLFSTHPSTSNRVAALHDMAHKQGGFGRGSNVDIERSERENNKSPWR